MSPGNLVQKSSHLTYYAPDRMDPSNFSWRWASEKGKLCSDVLKIVELFSAYSVELEYGPK